MDTIPGQLFLLQNQKQVGPFPLETIREMMRVGTLSANDLVWGEGLTEWVTAESLLGRPEDWIDPSLPEALQAPAGKGVAKGRRKGKGGTRPASFGWFVIKALDYPFRGLGWATVVSGTIVLSCIEWFQRLPAMPWILSLFLNLAAWGYLLQMLQTIIQRTAFGESDLPEWPEFEDWGALFGKWFQWAVSILVCAGPAIFLSIQLDFGLEDGDSPNILSWVLLALAIIAGAAYFPMGILGVAMYDTVGALNPLLILRSIARVPGHYVLTLVVFAALLGLKLVTVRFSEIIPIAGVMLDHFDSLWSSMFLARVLGGLYAVNREKLGWF